MMSFSSSIDLIKKKITGTRKGCDHVPNYIHSVRVCDTLKKFGFNETIQMGGLLHDIIEDGETTFDELKELGYTKEVIYLVDLSSHDMTCDASLQRRKDMMKRLISEENIDARAIKLADISDNLLECHMMPNKRNLASFLDQKCPVFVYYGNKYFGGTKFYSEFLERYYKQVQAFHS